MVVRVLAVLRLFPRLTLALRYAAATRVTIHRDLKTSKMMCPCGDYSNKDASRVRRHAANTHKNASGVRDSLRGSSPADASISHPLMLSSINASSRTAKRPGTSREQNGATDKPMKQVLSTNAKSGGSKPRLSFSVIDATQDVSSSSVVTKKPRANSATGPSSGKKSLSKLATPSVAAPLKSKKGQPNLADTLRSSGKVASSVSRHAKPLAAVAPSPVQESSVTSHSSSGPVSQTTRPIVGNEGASLRSRGFYSHTNIRLLNPLQILEKVRIAAPCPACHRRKRQPSTNVALHLQPQLARTPPRLEGYRSIAVPNLAKFPGYHRRQTKMSWTSIMTRRRLRNRSF